MKNILKHSYKLIFILPLVFISYAYSCADVCKKCQDDPTIPGCKEVLASGKCTVPPVTTTTTTSTTTTTLPPPTTTTTTTLPPSPSPSPSLCRFPQHVEMTQSAVANRFDVAVNDVVSVLTSCSPGSDCHTGLNEEAFMTVVTEKLRLRGFCAGQHEENISDEIAVACVILSDDKLTCLLSQCNTAWEGKHIAHFGGDKVVWCPGANRPSWTPVSCNVVPVPTPIPSPSQCPVKIGGDYYLDLHISMIGQNPQLYTATASYCGLPPRSDIFPNCRTKCCTLGVDGGSDIAIICEKELSGIPDWHGTGTLTLDPQPNPYNIKVTGGRGKLFACGKSGCSNEITF